MATPYKTSISSAASTIDLTTLATVKRELGITDGLQDTKLSADITQASRAIATYCNREFAKETLIDRFRLNNEIRPVELLQLSRTPIVSISSVVEDGITLASDEYEFDPATGFLWRLDGDDNRLCWAFSNIVVTFVAGYELLTTLPHDIERACIVMCKQSYYARTRDPLVKAEDVPGVLRQEFWIGGVGDNAAIPPEAEALLDPYVYRNV